MFLDVDMPRLNGIEACRQLRAGDESGDLTIVMLTASSGDNVESDAEEAGADLFLTKPFSPLDLLRLVEQLGERSAFSCWGCGALTAAQPHLPSPP